LAADDHDLLPEPPPPRPAGRDAAIAAALRRFDGEPDAAPQPRGSRAGSWTRHPQLGLALAASLVVIIGFPAAFIVLRDNGSGPAEAPAPVSPRAVHRAEPPGIAVNEAVNTVAAEPPTAPKAVDQLAKIQAATPPVQADERQAASAGENARHDVPAAPPPPMVAAAPAPPPPAPPPPPPPPVPPAVAQKSAEGGATNDLVVTGSRIASANREQSAARAERDAGATAPDWVLADRGYATFLTSLQRAVRAGDRGAVARLVHYPLRVNSGGQSRFYRDSAALRADYERIFTPQVRRAILDQRLDRLFGSSRGLMIGNGQLWFDRVCSNRSCSSPGPVRITAVNP
jgi:hypothetical protein